LRCGFALGDPQDGSFFFGDVTQLDWSRQALIIAVNGRMYHLRHSAISGVT
jgi:hypothetical protein